MISGVLIDLAGVVYEGDEKLPGAGEALAKLRQAGLPVRFVTNTTRSGKDAIIAALAKMQLTVKPEVVFTPVDAARDWLRQNNASPHLLVHEGIADAFAGHEDAAGKAVIIGDAGEAFSYAALNAAFREIEAGASLLALAANRYFRDRDGDLSLDAGPFVTALEFASGKKAILLGKPSSDFFDAALASMNCPAAEAVMIGDDVESDVSGALTAGIGYALLVQTGKYRPGDELGSDPRPTATVGDIADAAEWILAHRR